MHEPAKGNASIRPTELYGLDELAVGAWGLVVEVGGETEVRRRLLEMGLCNGARVEVVRRAPLGDPIQFRLRGYHLSLRAEQAKCVRVMRAGP